MAENRTLDALGHTLTDGERFTMLLSDEGAG